MERKDEEREKRVYEASVSGNVILLKQLMEEDSLTLARAAVTCFNETPLHVAAMLGHLDFTKYLLTQKPDMTMAVDSRGRSPLHLASANGYVEMVKVLLSANSDACLIQDDDGRTPLHLAVMKGQVEVVRKLFEAQREVKNRYKLDQVEGESLLHSAVKQNRLGVLKLLLELVGDDQVIHFLNSHDDYGNTVSHTATLLKQFETVKYPVDRPEMEVNAVNENGSTALDIIQRLPKDMKGMEIRDCLVKAGGLSFCRNRGERGSISVMIEKPQLPWPPPPPSTVVLSTEAKAEKPPPGRGDAGMRIKKSRSSENKKDWMKQKRDALMIAAILIIGMTFQIAVNPPGGVWDEDKQVENRQNNSTMLAGTSIMANYYPNYYELYMACNTVSFVASLSIVFLVVSGIPFVKTGILMWLLMIIMWIILSCIAAAYWLSMMVISPKFGNVFSATSERNKVPDITAVVNNSLFAWLCVLGIVILIHAIRFLVWCVRRVVWCVRKLFSCMGKVGKCQTDA